MWVKKKGGGGGGGKKYLEQNKKEPYDVLKRTGLRRDG